MAKNGIPQGNGDGETIPSPEWTLDRWQKYVDNLDPLPVMEEVVDSQLPPWQRRRMRQSTQRLCEQQSDSLSPDETEEILEYTLGRCTPSERTVIKDLFGIGNGFEFSLQQVASIHNMRQVALLKTLAVAFRTMRQALASTTR